MTAWRLIPLNNGPHVRVRVFAGVDLAHVTEVGELMLRPAEYGDLAARIGNTDGFSTETGRPLAVVSVVDGYELLDETSRILHAVEAERDELAKKLAVLQPAAGRYPCIRCGASTTPDRPYCSDCAPQEAEAGERTENAGDEDVCGETCISGRPCVLPKNHDAPMFHHDGVPR